MCVLGVPGDQKRLTDSLQLDLQTALSCPCAQWKSNPGPLWTQILLTGYHPNFHFRHLKMILPLIMWCMGVTVYMCAGAHNLRGVRSGVSYRYLWGNNHEHWKLNISPLKELLSAAPLLWLYVSLVFPGVTAIFSGRISINDNILSSHLDYLYLHDNYGERDKISSLVFVFVLFLFF